MREDETSRYELEPNYEVIDLLDSSDFQGIPGFDLSAWGEFAADATASSIPRTPGAPSGTARKYSLSPI